MPFYEIAVLGEPSDDQIEALRLEIEKVVGAFGLRLGVDVAWLVKPPTFVPPQRQSSVGVFFGASGASAANLDAALKMGTPILPVASTPGQVAAEIPEPLRRFNCLFYQTDGPTRVATAILECAGLLPRQRRVFVSYKRDESRAAALQLFDALAARFFDVFLDTHGVPPAEDFQAVLWHRLCDSDVLLALDTKTYFDSRWAAAEFGRALSKGIAVLRVEWPNCTPTARGGTASVLQLDAADVDGTTGRLGEDAIGRISRQLEKVRSEGLAVRHINLVSGLRLAVECIGGAYDGVGLHKGVHLKLPDGRPLVAYPVTGAPTSMALHEAAERTSGESVAVVYDHVGLQDRWLQHLDWLGTHVPKVRWVKAREANWAFGGWGVER